MSNNEAVVLPPRTNGNQVEQFVRSGQAVQQVRSSYTTAVAVQKERSITSASHKLMEECALAGESFYYGWGAGKDKIEGASIKLANAAARCWGNCAIELGPVQDLADSWIFTAYFVDLETGFTLPRQFRMSKRYVVYGKHDEARKEDIRFQIGQSKAIRNVILNALPEWFIDRALEKAKEGVMKKLTAWIAKLSKDPKEGIVKAVDLYLAEFKKLGVEEKSILAKLEIADKKAITVENLVRLAGDKQAIENGSERAEELFPDIKKPEAPPPTNDVAKQLAEEAAKKEPERQREPGDDDFERE